MAGPRRCDGMKRKPVVILVTVATAMLLGALGRWPYVYYQLLRWIVCGIAAFLAYRSYSWGRHWGLCLFGILAILFNPLVPFHLSRESWRVLDMIAAAGFCIGAVTLKATRDLRNASRESFVTRSGEDVSYRMVEDDEGFTLELDLKFWVPFAQDVEEALLVDGPARFKQWASETIALPNVKTTVGVI